RIPRPANYLDVPGLVVDVKVLSGTRVSFDVEPRSLVAGAPLRLLDGSVVVGRVATAEMLSSTAYQNDFPSMTAGRDGDVWVAWVAYRDHGDEVLARCFDGKAWGAAQTVTEKP